LFSIHTQTTWVQRAGGAVLAPHVRPAGTAAVAGGAVPPTGSDVVAVGAAVVEPFAVGDAVGLVAAAEVVVATPAGWCLLLQALATSKHPAPRAAASR
jgi:hypothetical protein